MSRRVIHLTETELKEMIYESVLPVLNETDAAAYARAHKATSKAKTDNQSGMAEPRTVDSMISPYKDIRYMFYCKNLRQNTGVVHFSLSSLRELTEEKAILKGDIVFNNQQMNGSIIVDIPSAKVVYYHSSSKKKYPLEIDNRFKSKWDSLVQELQKAAQLI